MNTAFKRTLLSTLVLPFALGVQSASAQIMTWDYTVANDFSMVNFTNGGATGSQSVSNVGTSTISWGPAAVADRSSISITDVDSATDIPARPKLVTDGASVNGGVFTHNNKAINVNFDTLETFDLTSTLTLTPLTPPGEGSIEALPTLTFKNRFTETLNQPASGTCADGSAATPQTPCPDIFTITDIEGLGPFDGSLPPQTFVQGGYLYSVFLQLDGLIALDSGECIAAGDLDGNCIGLRTPEGSENNFQTSFRITASKVPEPGTLALLGMGLAGLGLSRRKKAAKA